MGSPVLDLVGHIALLGGYLHRSQRELLEDHQRTNQVSLGTGP